MIARIYASLTIRLACEYFGSCGAASGVGNGSKYDNNATGCKSAMFVALRLVSRVVFGPRTIRGRSGFCSTATLTNKEDCIGVVLCGLRWARR